MNIRNSIALLALTGLLFSMSACTKCRKAGPGSCDKKEKKEHKHTHEKSKRSCEK